MTWAEIAIRTGQILIGAVIGGGIGGAIVRHYLSRKHYSYIYYEDRKRDYASKIHQSALKFQGEIPKLHTDLLDQQAQDLSPTGQEIERLKSALNNLVLESAVYFDKDVMTKLLDGVNITNSVIRRMTLLEAKKKVQGVGYGYNPQAYIDWYDQYYLHWIIAQMKAILKGEAPDKKAKWKSPPSVGSLRIGQWP